jgi:hypothetical protein
MRAVYSIILLLFFGLFFSQEIKPFDTIKTEKQVVEEIENANVSTIQKYNPTKAGLYSAVFPGLGQYYNKKYWKIPIVWGAVGTGVGIIVYNDKQYRRYRTAFLAELNGQPHEFDDLPYVDATVLGNTQDRAKRQRDYAIAITGVLYILNIVDAVVDAHLYDQKKDPDLAIKPTIIYDDLGVANGKAGLSLSFRF